jgi:NTP pyrophosphatase (non-canonical NTP hydrolase)
MIDTFAMYEKQTAVTDADSGRVPADVFYALALNEEAGELAGKVKKVHGYFHGEWDKERRDMAIKEMGDVMWYLARMAASLGTNLSEVATANIIKLKDRARRGVIAGEGDRR